MKLRVFMWREAVRCLTLIYLVKMLPVTVPMMHRKLRLFGRRWFGRNRQSIVRFLTVGAASRFLVQTPVLYLATDKFHVHYLTSSFIAVGASFVFVYLGNRYWAFPETQRHHIVVAPEDAL